MTSAGPGLLVSVRDVAEAAAALEGGADIIDVKEPARGPLGRADDQAIADIIGLVGKRRPVSAALGEWTGLPFPLPDGPLSFIKWGLAGLAAQAWQPALDPMMTFRGHGPRPVLVAYADWENAQSPPVEEVAAAAHSWGCGLLLDTFDKKPNSPTLLNWLPRSEIVALCRRCRQQDVPVALAGSLGPDQIVALAEARPNWFGVRGAACDGGRQGRICREKVRKLVDLVKGCFPHGSSTTSSPARLARAGIKGAIS